MKRDPEWINLKMKPDKTSISVNTITHLKNKHQRMTNEIKILMKTNELLTQHIEELEEIISPS